ncbi:hypothetical protein A7982_13740 [Minicystis rosea]|nr:hypothetical protein A7982_13740 [Minicystis rosea]
MLVAMLAACGTAPERAPHAPTTSSTTTPVASAPAPTAGAATSSAAPQLPPPPPATPKDSLSFQKLTEAKGRLELLAVEGRVLFVGTRASAPVRFTSGGSTWTQPGGSYRNEFFELRDGALKAAPELQSGLWPDQDVFRVTGRWPEIDAWSTNYGNTSWETVQFHWNVAEKKWESLPSPSRAPEPRLDGAAPEPTFDKAMLHASGAHDWYLGEAGIYLREGAGWVRVVAWKLTQVKEDNHVRRSLSLPDDKTTYDLTGFIATDATHLYIAGFARGRTTVLSSAPR